MSSQSFEDFKVKAETIMSPLVDNNALMNTYLAQMNTGREGSVDAYKRLVALIIAVIINVPMSDKAADELQLLLSNFTDSQMLLIEATRNVLTTIQNTIMSISKVYDLVEDCFVEGDEDASMEKDG